MFKLQVMEEVMIEDAENARVGVGFPGGQLNVHTKQNHGEHETMVYVVVLCELERCA